ncbi:MAG TPA: DNA translocase FtsK [Anaerolineales bacterium]|jgi:S-DNA-T family DNA segregation ATPase FtsK/SpoIIIE|nr:DNA translocase FtsK [Anaerolineales bacterium]
MAKRYPKETSQPNQGQDLESTSGFSKLSFRILGMLQRYIWDIAGVFLLTVGLLTFLALLDLTQGVVITWWAEFLQRWFGWGSYLFIPIALGVGIVLIIQRSDILEKINWGRILILEIAIFAALALLAVAADGSLERASLGLDGGLVGWGLAELMGTFIRPTWLLALILAVVILISVLIGSGVSAYLGKLAQSYAAEGAGFDGSEPAVSIGEQVSAEFPTQNKKKVPRLPAEFRKKFKIRVGDDKGTDPPVRDERLPSLDLMINEQTTKPDERNINLTAGLIEKTLAEFGIPARVVGFQVGPTVTQFAVEPGFVEKPGNEEEIKRQKVRVAQIAALSRDLALALSAPSLRIEAPVPGRPYIGIEVPNTRSTIVRLRPILETEAFYKFGSPLTIALGRDVSGQAVVADLASMPHLLIAGTTGSGKSVSIAALTTCLVMNNTPEDLRMVMIDPKMVELVRFNGLPHLFGKVETDLVRILGVLRWTVAEMDRRYKLLETSRSRNIDTYNRKMRKKRDSEPLPHIVVMIDELADLMMSAPEQTEPALVRLAQMARATGIHLVVATQRPSTDVVTGLIKANFPARISFAVASSIDSRVILDSTGAESLLGRGDMLFLPPEAGSPIRAQGAMVTDQEIERMITFWQETYPPDEEHVPPWDALLDQEAILAQKDQLIDKAIAIVQETQRASASMLQRRLRIGYPRAARLIDELEDLGVVGPSQGGGREREVLIGPEDDLSA